MANPIDRCEWCRASYASFRGGKSTAQAQADIEASTATDDGSATFAVASDLRSEDNARKVRNAGCGMKLAGQIKRAAWFDAHGPGRCVFDVERFIIDYRRAHSSTVADHAWRLRELIADLLLGEDDDTADDDSVDVDLSFDPDEFASVPEYIDDGNATTCLAA